MSSQNTAVQGVRFVNSLLGVVLILAAGLDILLLGLIGWAAWDRATLADQVQRMAHEDTSQLPSSQAEAQQLRTLIAASREAISSSMDMLPSDTEIGRSITDLTSTAAKLGITITELSPQPNRPADFPARRFALRARGGWSTLQQFLVHTTQALPNCQLEGLAIRRNGDRSEVEFNLIIAARPLDTMQLAPAADPGAPNP